MPNILVRGLDGQVVNRLKAIAKHHRRSLQGEVKAILVEAVSFLTKEAQTVSLNWKKTLSGRNHSDSAGLIRQDRDR